MASKASPVNKTEADTTPEVEVKIEDGAIAAPAANFIAEPKVVSEDTNGNRIEEN